MAAVEYKAKDGSTEILPLFPTSEIQMVRFMLGNSTVELHNNLLSDGARTLDVLICQNQDSSTNIVPPTVVDHRSSSSIVHEPAQQDPSSSLTIVPQLFAGSPEQLDPELDEKERLKMELKEHDKKRIKYAKEMRSGLLVLASVYVALTFQAGMSPPGGVWQDDSSTISTSLSPSNNATQTNITTISSNNQANISNSASNGAEGTNHTAGNPVLQNKDDMRFYAFTYANTVAFVLSACTIILLLSETYYTSVMLSSSIGINGIKIAVLMDTVSIVIAFSFGIGRDAISTLTPIFSFLCFFPLPFIGIWKERTKWRKIEKKVGQA